MCLCTTTRSQYIRFSWTMRQFSLTNTTLWGWESTVNACFIKWLHQQEQVVVCSFAYHWDRLLSTWGFCTCLINHQLCDMQRRSNIQTLAELLSGTSDWTKSAHWKQHHHANMVCFHELTWCHAALFPSDFQTGLSFRQSRFLVFTKLTFQNVIVGFPSSPG